MSKKVLIVEDDKFLSNACKLKLESTGHEVKVANDGREALEVLGQYTPDVIMLDIILPVMDGFAVLEKLKSDEKWKKIPVIVASNLGQNEDVEKGLRLGADDYLIKSNFLLKELVEKIDGFIKNN